MNKAARLLTSVGFSAQRMARLEAAMQRYVDQDKLPCIQTMVYRCDQLVQSGCYGVMDLETKRPLRPDALYRIFSMTKPITCTAVMALYEEGHFRLYDPVSAYIPEFKEMQVFSVPTEGGSDRVPAKRPITIHDLLTHTSGLAYGLDESTPVDIMYRRAKMLRTDELLADKIKRLAQMPLMSQPGERYAYSISIDVLGYLVEVISGKTLDVFLQERIFDPLGMVDTGFNVPPEKLERLVEGYLYKEDGSRVNFKDEVIIEDSGLFDKSQPLTFLMGGGGLVSSASDYLRFARMLLNNGELEGERILGPKTVEHMTLNQLPPGLMVGPGMGMGYGVGVTTDPAAAMTLVSPGTFGWGGAAGTECWIDPQENLVGLIMVQIMPGNLFPVQPDFRTLVLQAIEA